MCRASSGRNDTWSASVAELELLAAAAVARLVASDLPFRLRPGRPWQCRPCAGGRCDRGSRSDRRGPPAGRPPGGRRRGAFRVALSHRRELSQLAMHGRHALRLQSARRPSAARRTVPGPDRDSEDLLRDGVPDAGKHLVEDLKALELVLQQGVLLAVGAQVHRVAQCVEVLKVILPPGVDQTQILVADEQIEVGRADPDPSFRQDGRPSRPSPGRSTRCRADRSAPTPRPAW